MLTSSTDASLRWSSNTTTLARRCRRGASTPSLEDDHLPRRPAVRPGRCAMGPRRANQRRALHASTSRRFSSDPAPRATSSSSTISAGTRDRRPAAPSGAGAHLLCRTLYVRRQVYSSRHWTKSGPLIAPVLGGPSSKFRLFDRCWSSTRTTMHSRSRRASISPGKGICPHPFFTAMSWSTGINAVRPTGISSRPRSRKVALWLPW